MLENRWNECITLEENFVENEVEFYLKVVVLLKINLVVIGSSYVEFDELNLPFVGVLR